MATKSMHLDGDSVAKAIDEAVAEALPVPLPTPTTGDAGKVVTVNGAETGYELDAPSRAPRLITFPFDHTMHAALANGVAIPNSALKAGDLLTMAWIGIAVGDEWDGTTPTGEIYLGSDATFGVGGGGGSQVDMTSASEAFEDAGANYTTFQAPAQGAYADLVGQYYRIVNTDVDAIYVVVSQDASKGGTDPGSTTGSAVLYLRIEEISFT